MHATYSRFNFLCLCFSPPSGKTFGNSFSKRKPLSALRATLPEGESFLSRHLRATLPEGESSYRHCVSLSPKGKALLYIMLIHILFCSAMPAKNNTNLGLAACFQTNTLFRNRHIRVYYAVCAPRLSLKTRRNTCRQPKRRYFR